MEENEEMIENVEAVTTEEQAGAQGNEEGNEQDAEKKYTDADLDKIIARKIAAERKRMSKLFNEEQQESEIDIRERKVLERELKADAKDTLIEQGLPSSLADIMSYGNKEDFDKSFGEVTTIFRESIQQGVKNALKGDVPRTGMGNTPNQEKALRNAFAPKNAL